MLPGNVDPRRPEKVQRYKPSPVSTNGQGEDLTPDYMNILGQQSATAANAQQDGAELNAGGEPKLVELPHEDVPITTTNATNVIPTSPQYGVAIISNNENVSPTENNALLQPTSSSDNQQHQQENGNSNINNTNGNVSKASDDNVNKDPQSTPSRNDRFKVVKIASLEPFKRGRWKCMDYVDEVPPQTAQQPAANLTQSSGNIQVQGLYMQTQSLPQQQIQQILLQGGYTNGTQFFQNVTTHQMVPQTQTYFYPPGTSIPQQQIVNAAGVPSSMPAQFINSSQQYYPQNVVVPNSTAFTIPQNYQSVQYVPANMLQQNQGSAFVATSQNVQLPLSFQQQQGQTYTNQQNNSVPAPILNGHTFPQQQTTDQQQQQQINSVLPTQAAKNVVMGGNVPQPVVSQSQMQQIQANNSQPIVSVVQSQHVQQQPSVVAQFQQQMAQPQSGASPQLMTLQQQQNLQQQQVQQQQQQIPTMTSQNYEQGNNMAASNVYTNPQFATSVNSLTILENVDNSAENVNENLTSNSADGVSNNGSGENPGDDPAKTNPVVNAIDNKIEQAMDLVKSHLMYTVREEVEVLKEKIAELMERIQQLETENNYLRSQIPKNQSLSLPASSASPNNGGVQASASQITVVLPTSSQNTNANVNAGGNPVNVVASAQNNNNISTQAEHQQQ